MAPGGEWMASIARIPEGSVAGEGWKKREGEKEDRRAIGQRDADDRRLKNGGRACETRLDNEARPTRRYSPRCRVRVIDVAKIDPARGSPNEELRKIPARAIGEIREYSVKSLPRVQTATDSLSRGVTEILPVTLRRIGTRNRGI